MTSDAHQRNDRRPSAVEDRPVGSSSYIGLTEKLWVDNFRTDMHFTQKQ